MKVLHINTFDQFGGAARAAYRLHTGLQRIGVESRMLVADKRSTDHTVIQYEPPQNPWNRIRREIRRRSLARSLNRYRVVAPGGLQNFSDDRTIYGSDPWRNLPDHDVIHLHWIAGFIDFSEFLSQMPRKTPTVWTLHDMNPFTGGCHYDEDCGRFTAACGACPQLRSEDRNDLSHEIWQRKRHALATIPAGRLHVVADSKWLASEASRSSAFAGLPVTAIHYGLDVEIFAPRDRQAARSVLGIPADARVVLFVADHVEMERKGFAFLIQALAALPGETSPFLLSMGRGVPSLSAPFPHLHLGYISQDRFLSIVYSAADVFVIPSLQEAFGQTALEAMACATPVVGFDVGGIREVVIDGFTGLLVPVRDSQALQEAIKKLLRNPSLQAELASNCREIAVQEYGLHLQAKRYLALYQQMLNT